MQIRQCTQEDISAVQKFNSTCSPLAVHTGYTYWILYRYFAESCFVMEENGAIVGLVSGMKSSTHPDVFFLWQIGVARELRGKKLSYLLLEKIEEVAKRLNCRRMQFTIESDNDESLSMFQGFARKRGVELSAIGKAEFPHSKLNTIWVETIYELPI